MTALEARNVRFRRPHATIPWLGELAPRRTVTSAANALFPQPFRPVARHPTRSQGRRTLLDRFLSALTLRKAQQQTNIPDGPRRAPGSRHPVQAACPLQASPLIEPVRTAKSTPTQLPRTRHPAGDQPGLQEFTDIRVNTGKTATALS